MNSSYSRALFFFRAAGSSSSCHTSHITHHTSHITHHTSHITHHKASSRPLPLELQPRPHASHTCIYITRTHHTHTSHASRHTAPNRHNRTRAHALRLVRCRFANAVDGMEAWHRVWGLGFGVWGLGFGVWGLGFGVWGLGFGVDEGMRVKCFQGWVTLGRPFDLLVCGDEPGAKGKKGLILQGWGLGFGVWG
jgi:hypothetical protein